MLYCYKHTYCTDLQAAGISINVFRELMGYSDISITTKIYTHHSEDAFSNAAEHISKYMDSLYTTFTATLIVATHAILSRYRYQNRAVHSKKPMECNNSKGFTHGTPERS